jgi:hypothetical protein
MESHSRLERLLRRIWATGGDDELTKAPLSMHSLARFAMARGLLNPAEVNVLTELTNLRNRVVYQDDAVVTAESANRYAALALKSRSRGLRTSDRISCSLRSRNRR